jgi:hypothetical protein
MRRKHKALLIGVKDYNPPGRGGPDLCGPINDVNDMKGALINCDFNEESMLILTDECATKSNILSGVSWLLSDNEEGDSVVFYFAGHGSYRVKYNDHINVQEQVIRTHASSQEIAVSELEQLFINRRPDIHLEVFMDCCHSGPPNQAINLGVPAEPGLVVRFVPPSDDSVLLSPMIFNIELLERYFFQPEVIESSQASHVLWAACKINQQAAEKRFGSQVKGVFTYHLCSLLRRTKGNITRGKLDSLLAQEINCSVANQVPQVRARSSAVSNQIFM